MKKLWDEGEVRKGCYLRQSRLSCQLRQWASSLAPLIMRIGWETLLLAASRSKGREVEWTKIKKNITIYANKI